MNHPRLLAGKEEPIAAELAAVQRKPVNTAATAWLMTRSAKP